MDRLLEDTVDIIKDYRNDDGIQITTETLKNWVLQFDVNDQTFILEELKPILDKRYISKSSAQGGLKKVIEKLTEDYNFSSPEEFLKSSSFLDLQELGKSQKDLLKLCDALIQQEYNLSLDDCGKTSIKNVIYLDDMLCTGNTLYYDLKHWLESKREDNLTNLEFVKSKNVNVIFAFFITHELNHNKVCYRLKLLDSGFSRFYKTYRFFSIENEYSKRNSKLDFIFPVRENQSDQVMNYYNSLGVSNFNGIFRDKQSPAHEEFFSTPENRIRFENILLNKSLEILNTANVNIENMRPLGYTLPSHKNFGFGTLSFTWRNVPNNTPLVFWYSAGVWTPLFQKK